MNDSGSEFGEAFCELFTRSPFFFGPKVVFFMVDEAFYFAISVIFLFASCCYYFGFRPSSLNKPNIAVESALNERYPSHAKLYTNKHTVCVDSFHGLRIATNL